MLPQELLVEILSRLPVQSLLRFRSVSKALKSLIDSSRFLKSHLSQNRNSKIFLFNVESVSNGIFEAILSFTEVDLVDCSHSLHFQPLTLPWLSPLNIKVVGSCDGLICLSTGHFSLFVLLNPSTREYKLLPPISKRIWAAGLGYDCSEDEYKVLAILEDGSEVYIYGSKSNTWRQRQMDVPGICNSCKYRGFTVYTHGALHWIVGCCDQVFHIVAFNLINEKFTAAEYNKNLFGNPGYVLLLAVGERLCLYCKHNVGTGAEGYMHIWVMEEYGVRESWSKLVSFDRDVRPLAFSNCGRRLLFKVFQPWPCSCRLHWYDLDKKSLEHVDSWMTSHYHVCSQSLIRLESKLPLVR